MRRQILSGLTAALLLSGCSGNGEPAPPAAADPDLVHSAAPLWQKGDAWTVAAEPTLVIGVDEGPEMLMLSRVFGAARLASGEYLVANAGSGELRFFDGEGGFVRAVGGHGQGPGEFAEFSSLSFAVAGDGRIVVDDSGNGRLNVFAADGGFLEVVRPEPMAEASRFFLVDAFDDGGLLLRAPEGGGRLQGEPGTLIDMAFGYYLFEGSAGVRELMRRPGRRRYVHGYGDIVHFPYVPFSPEPLVVAGPGLYVVPEQQPELLVIDLQGELERRYRWEAGPGAPAAEEWDRYREISLATISDPEFRDRYDHFYREDLPLPERVPFYERLLRDDGGAFWLERYRMDSLEPVRYDVLDARGRWLGTVDGPSNLVPYQVTDDALVGVHRDDMGLQTVRVYPVVKPVDSASEIE